MNLTPAFSWLIIFTLPLTLGLKVVSGSSEFYESKADIGKFLLQQGFDIEEQTVAGVPTIAAVLGSCRMRIVEASPNGWSRDWINQVLGAERHFIVYRGTIYSEQPTWRTFTENWWSKSLHKLGIAQRTPPVIAVSATASCNSEQLPWRELSSRSGSSLQVTG